MQLRTSLTTGAFLGSTPTRISVFASEAFLEDRVTELRRRDQDGCGRWKTLEAPDDLEKSSEVAMVY